MAQKKGNLEVNITQEGRADCLIIEHGVDDVQKTSFGSLVAELVKSGLSNAQATQVVNIAKRKVANAGTFQDWCKAHGISKSSYTYKNKGE